MLYHLLYPLKQKHIIFNLFRYITFRTAGAATTSFLICIILAPILIRYLKRLGAVSQIRVDVPERHKVKKGTPTMGGVLLVLATLFSTLLWADLSSWYIWLSLIIMICSSLLGFVDDYVKDVKKSSNGLIIRQKLLFQIILGLAVGVFLYYLSPSKSLRGVTETLFLKELMINLGVFYIPFIAFVLVGTVNAINIVDGLDGLAGGLSAIAVSVFAIVAYIAGRSDFSRYLSIFYLPGAGELSIFAASLVGGLLGFLWYNSYPAEIFLGDTGSLALGGAISAIAILLKKELLLVVVGGVFVLETLSVIIQILSFKLFKKRVFKIAPIHHSFELSGIAEPKIVVRFWIVGLIFALFGLGTFKMR